MIEISKFDVSAKDFKLHFDLSAFKTKMNTEYTAGIETPNSGIMSPLSVTANL